MSCRVFRLSKMDEFVEPFLWWRPQLVKSRYPVRGPTGV